jgi:hypothetical protein
MDPHDILWGTAPGPGPARRNDLDEATQRDNRRMPSVAFFGLCLIGLAVVLMIGVLRLIFFGPWWVTHRAQTSAPSVENIHRPSGNHGRPPEPAQFRHTQHTDPAQPPRSSSQ